MRSDDVVHLIRAHAQNDRESFKKTLSRMVANERAKGRDRVASRLEAAANTSGGRHGFVPMLNGREHRGVMEYTPQKTFMDLALTPTTLRVCREVVEEHQKIDFLREHDLEPRHRLLFVGPPGNGKTTLAEALANQLGVRFFIMRYESLIGSLLGETASRVKKALDALVAIPSVIFFDEFDAVGAQRTVGERSSGAGEMDRVVNSLLMIVDELPSTAILVAATNHSDLLDRASWRRFQVRLTLDAPTKEQLMHYFGAVAPLGLEPEVMAEELFPISYAEAEEFSWDVRRRLAINGPGAEAEPIFRERLELWRERATA